MEQHKPELIWTPSEVFKRYKRELNQGDLVVFMSSGKFNDEKISEAIRSRVMSTLKFSTLNLKDIEPHRLTYIREMRIMKKARSTNVTGEKLIKLIKSMMKKKANWAWGFSIWKDGDLRRNGKLIYSKTISNDEKNFFSDDERILALKKKSWEFFSKISLKTRVVT